MNKTINFFLDKDKIDINEINKYDGLKYSDDNYMKYKICYTYKDTEKAIIDQIDNIFTTSLININFELLDFGYDIYIICGDKRTKIYPGMDVETGKEIRFGHNLRRLILGGALDETIGYERPYDNFTQAIIKAASQSAVFEMGKGVKAITNEESYEWHKKHSRIDPKTGNLIISDDEIGDGTFEKKYNK